MGKGIVDLSEKYGKFDRFDLATSDLVGTTLVPNADDDWKSVAHKLWSRLYTLEKRLFMETLYGSNGNVTSVDVNGVVFNGNRLFSKTYTDEHFGTCQLLYNFHIVGNI